MPEGMGSIMVFSVVVETVYALDGTGRAVPGPVKFAMEACEGRFALASSPAFAPAGMAGFIVWGVYAGFMFWDFGFAGFVVRDFGSRASCPAAFAPAAGFTILNLRTTTSQKCEAVLGRARI